ncbi:cTAGE family member 2 isoform X2 [Polypterus senegalus]|uniref:cTAGE family member 2 isoform X2 n=1 Tax=Polypterus senegalus TaxID=55291 RepID=UPI00196324A7|nr:cTAGE family member 2 isoform X2 [Polypterus senegalus]
MTVSGAHQVLLVLFLLSFFATGGLGLLSDYKLCGDPECESLLSRVQAIRDYKGPDCRFLHLKTGDVIFVYHKLSGKRSDLWAGSMGKLFGYFAKDAVRTEELYAPKEIQIPTKDEDFLCVDGSMPSMENEDEWEAEDIQNSESQTSALVLDIAAEGHVSSSSHDEDFSSKERSSVLVQHNEDNKEMEVSEQSGSSWLGSGFTNWLGFGEQKGQEAKPEITQEDSFKGRKIALDLSDNIREDDIVEIMETKKPDPIDNGLSSVLNFDKRETVQLEDTKNVMPQKNDKMGKINTVKEGEESTFKKDNQQLHMGQESSSSSWIPFSISKVLSLSRETDDRQTHEKNENIKRDHGEDVEKVLDEKKQEKKISEDSIVQDHNDTIKGHDHVHAEKEEPLPYMQNGEQLSPNFVSENKKNEPASIQEDQMKDEQNKEEEKSDENIPGCIREACQETRKNIKADKYEQAREQSQSAAEVLSWKGHPETKSTVTPIVPHTRDMYTSLNTIKEGGMAILKSLQASRLYQPFRLCLESFGKQAVSALPEDMRPGPDLYGFPWEAVIITAFIGIVTALLFLFRFCQSIKSRLYAGREKQLGAKISELLEEKCSILETLSECTQQYKKLEDVLSNGGLIDQVNEKENMQAMCLKLEQSNTDMTDEIKRINVDLNIQKSTRTQQNQLLEEMLTSLKSLEKEAESIKSEIEQTHTTLKVYEISSVKLHTNLQAAKEENLHLKESEAQLFQEVEGWGERLGELTEQIKICEMSQKEMQEDCSNKECQIKSLTDCLLKMKDWHSEIEEEIDGDKNTEMENEAHSDDQKQKIEKLIHAAKMNADLKSVDEDKNQLLARLNDEMKAKDDLQERIDELQNNKDFLLARSSEYTTEIEKLQQKLQIMTEMYQENELKLHRKLTIEEKERMQKEEKLTKADEKISLAAEELNSYRLRAKELDEELDRTNQSYKNQIASHEKKAHDNWLAARAAERDLTEIKREKAHLRQKLTDAQFKLEMIQKDPYALDVPGMHPFRGERSPFGPSPLGRPASETRAFLSPPTLVDGPPRISPQFPAGPGGRASREPQILADHPMLSEGVDPNSERILDNRSTHSDSGSLSPTWDRDRRVHVPPPPGYPYIDPMLPFRRPPSGRLSGPAEIRGFIPPSADKIDEPDVNISEDSGNNMITEITDPPAPIPGGPLHPPEADLRIGPGFGPPVIRPPLDPRGQFIHGGRYGPPEFLPVRGPVPILPRGRPPLLPGMFPRFPFLPPGHGYPPLRPPMDGGSGLPYRPSPPADEQTEN